MAEVKVAGKRKAKMGPAQGVLAVVLNAILILFSISCIFPLFWMLNSALKQKREFNADIIGIVKSPTLDNFINILSNANYHLGQSIENNDPFRILYRTVRFYRWIHSGACKIQGKPPAVWCIPYRYADPAAFPAGTDLCCI